MNGEKELFGVGFFCINIMSPKALVVRGRFEDGEVFSMHESVDIDEKLLDTALRAGGMKTKKETVDLALREFVRKRRAEELISLFGTIDYDVSYDYKQERNRA